MTEPQATRTAGTETSATDAPNVIERSGWRSVLGWAAYLGCSWTWCIGMFLPVLLVRDFGLLGFVVFAVPNVIGAAAMGWVIRTREQSHELVSTHRCAVSTFSYVTLAFHAFFLGWLTWLLAPLNLTGPPFDLLLGLILPVAVLIIGLTLLRGYEFLASLLVWVASITLGILFMAWGGESQARQGHFPSVSMSLASDLWFLAPVCVFGFAACPYLDATFLRARQHLSPSGSRGAFGIGFGIVFFLMILLTLGYSAALVAATSSGDRTLAFVSAGAWGCLLSHIVLQSAFTTIVHLRAAPHNPLLRRGNSVLLTLCWLLIFAIGFATRFFDGSSHAGLTYGEILYRSFMSFYGLVFPAYVWICMIPTGRDGHRHSGIEGPLGRRKLLVTLGAIVVASPMFWMGFIERESWWLAPGLGVVLLARLFVLRAGSDAPKPVRLPA